MYITYDPAKREATLAARGLDFEDARIVFEGPNFETEDRRKDYGESRFICFGYLDDRLVVVGYTQRGAARHVFSMRKPMTANKRVSRRSLGSDLSRVASHVIQPQEYDELPELTDEMLARGKVNKGGRPRSLNPKRLISIRLTEEVIQRWRATGPGWQTRMAAKLSRYAPK